MALTMLLFEDKQLAVLVIPCILRLLTPPVPVVLSPLIITVCLPAKADFIEHFDHLVV
jgi:hypothetical protein